MSHLSFETIARLVDEQPSPLDNAHLDACATCRAELDAMRADVTALASLPDLDPADNAWLTIEARLEAEGLLRKNTRTLPLPLRSRSYMPLARAAAIAAIFAGGALVGHTVGASARAPQQLANNTTTNTTTNATNAQHATSAGNAASSTVSSTGSTLASTGSAIGANGANGANGNTIANAANTANTADAARNTTASATGPVRLASTGNARNTNGTASADGDAALRNLRSAEDKYFSALSSYSEKAGTETTDPNARLAVLEGIVLTTGAALAQAPTDPVINGYHLTALAQRDALLKQIKATPARVW